MFWHYNSAYFMNENKCGEDDVEKGGDRDGHDPWQEEVAAVL